MRAQNQGLKRASTLPLGLSHVALSLLLFEDQPLSFLLQTGLLHLEGNMATGSLSFATAVEQASS